MHDQSEKHIELDQRPTHKSACGAFRPDRCSSPHRAGSPHYRFSGRFLCGYKPPPSASAANPRRSPPRLIAPQLNELPRPKVSHPAQSTYSDRGRGTPPRRSHTSFCKVRIAASLPLGGFFMNPPSGFTEPKYCDRKGRKGAASPIITTAGGKAQEGYLSGNGKTAMEIADICHHKGSERQSYCDRLDKGD